MRFTTIKYNTNILYGKNQFRLRKLSFFESVCYYIAKQRCNL